jgi:hypothetical protein
MPKHKAVEAVTGLAAKQALQSRALPKTNFVADTVHYIFSQIRI